MKSTKNIYSDTANLDRRKFLTSVTKAVGTSVILTFPRLSFAGKFWPKNYALTVQQVIAIILKEIPGAPFATTVDQLRTGTMDQMVTGIVTTTFPTLEVIEQTAKVGANFIIAHETPFYNNQDETDWLEKDEVYQYKIALLKKHNIAIWRFHDYWHAHKPDGILMGTLSTLGWEKYYNPENPRLLTLPNPVAVKAIVALTKEKLGISTVRLVGDLKQNCTRIYMALGYMDSKRQIAAIEEFKPDLFISGETREWETVERVRDGRRMGQKTSLLVLSHAVSEEAGMQYAVKWLQPKVPGIKITHIPAKNPFTFV
ncbi:NGG1p interacting factor NIF3 [Adhaeribacter arboris]|uniref:NGG1p interacting factor NIF3 n=1 Tax=Adhaeribacter arboris TaxID=2072846 RepID=A0A2T2YC45_9BACT|nr:Nif3-like dinuclear metal center hexameric protein [Adhaeribacter arboris]PSR53079.1 NGG1p interacting factor NIF3 [Adhaeribacter arboris]